MEDPLEKGTATHSSILACRIPWGHQKSSILAWRIPWGHKELHGVYGVTESDTTERLSLSCSLAFTMFGYLLGHSFLYILLSYVSHLLEYLKKFKIMNKKFLIFHFQVLKINIFGKFRDTIMSEDTKRLVRSVLKLYLGSDLFLEDK